MTTTLSVTTYNWYDFVGGISATYVTTMPHSRTKGSVVWPQLNYYVARFLCMSWTKGSAIVQSIDNILGKITMACNDFHDHRLG